MSDRAISVQELRFGWAAQAQPCLDIPAFDVQAGERVFLHGPSGSGKSTLLALLGGVLVPRRGRLQVLGAELTELTSVARDRFRADHIGFVFQQFNLVPYLSVIENVLLPCRFSRRRRDRALATGGTLGSEALRLLQRLDMARSLRDRPVTQLSVGQQQRVAAARALIGKPEIVIADEPTSSLDAPRQADFIHLLLQECSAAGATVVFVSHDLRLAEAFGRVLDLQTLNRAGPVAQ